MHMYHWTLKVFVLGNARKNTFPEQYVSPGAQLVSENGAAYLADKTLAERFLDACYPIFDRRFKGSTYTVSLRCYHTEKPSIELMHKIQKDSEQVSFFAAKICK